MRPTQTTLAQRNRKATMKQPYKIYRDPIPEPMRRQSLAVPFAHMRVGEFADVPARTARSPSDLALSARRWAQRNGRDWRFLVRIVNDTVKIWRVK